ncbi:MAG: chemotaxis protein CheD [Verrucomicrobiota bacterium]|jgi:chemotaxis protein CheD
MMGFERNLVVGVGGLAVSNNQAMILTTYSLGSCLGVTIYDPVRRAGGLLHAMLPDSSINTSKASEQPAMFVDTGMGALFRAAYALKAEKRRLQICVAGGAQFLDQTGVFNIGQRNYACLIQLLDQHGLSIDAKDVGGLVSRTLHLYLSTGEVRLKISGQSTETILFRGYANIG